MRLIRVALTRGIAPISLEETHLTGGVHTLQIRLAGRPVMVLAAELAGETATGSYALRLAPLDPSHVPELIAIAESDSNEITETDGPLSKSTSAIFDSEPPLPQRDVPAALSPRSPGSSSSRRNDGASSSTGMRAFTKTIPDPEPDDVEEDELEASVLFDPEAALISRAPPRPPATNADDTLTIPVRASMMPSAFGPQAFAPPAAPQRASDPAPRAAQGTPSVHRAPNDPLTVSHLSIPSTTNVPTTERELIGEISFTAEGVASTERQGGAAADVAPDPLEKSLSVTVDFDTSSSSIHTDRQQCERGWTSEAHAPDPSLGESVVFDPDVLARETRPRSVAPPPMAPIAPGPASSTAPGHSAPDEDGVSVVFEDLSLTPTAPMDVPPRRIPSVRGLLTHDPDQRIDDEAETFPSSSSRGSRARENTTSPRLNQTSPPETLAARSAAASSGRGPRTMRRTLPLDVVVPGRVIANRYRIESLVGSGAVGAVYKASHIDLPRTFAIKVLHPHFRADQQLIAGFRTEARAASLLDHPNVTVVHDFGEEPDGLVYIVMEYLQGVNLQAILDEQRRLDPRRSIGIMLQVCGALAAAHQRGIVHRDVKPDNIMLIPTRDDEGRSYELVKVCDFGIAALETAPDAQSEEWTAGTPEYMAPEQAHGRFDARTDVYACGIVLYEMLTGRPPFVGDSPMATLAKHATEAPRRPSELVTTIPSALEAVILCAIEKAPARRFTSIRDLRAELKRLL